MSLKKLFYIITFLYFLTGWRLLISDDNVSTIAKNGDNVEKLLKRYFLPTTQEWINHFIDLNKDNLLKKNKLKFKSRYLLPIIIIPYDGKSLATSIPSDSKEQIKYTEKYNKKVEKSGLKSKSYKKDKQIWMPAIIDWVETDSKPMIKDRGNEESSENENKKSGIFPILGKKYEKVKVLDRKLKNRVYYLVSGHGGPDPGAIGQKEGHDLCEDEYAYDVVLRLGRKLLEHSATVYFIVNDPGDGIRDEKYLEPSSNETYLGGDSISSNQVTRLNQKVKIVNDLYEKNIKRTKSQTFIEIHLDSRVNEKRIDIFFYYKEDYKPGKDLADILCRTIKNKYEINQPGRGYQGNVSTRNLHMLRKVKPTSVYIELGNIQNAQDQIRFIESNNRQAIANWLCEGLMRAAKEPEE